MSEAILRAIPPTSTDGFIYYYVGQKSADYDRAGTFGLCEGASGADICKEFGIGKSAASRIKLGQAWDCLADISQDSDSGFPDFQWID